MTAFEKPLAGFRYAETNFGDTMQMIAYRELGDANLWTSLTELNGLVPPYIVDDPALVAPGVVRTGTKILVPAPVPVASAMTDPSLVFQGDMLLTAGGLTDDGAGDFSVVSGLGNLVQFLKNLIATDQGELIFHPQYGCAVHRVVGQVNGPISALLARDYVRAAIEADPRVQTVSQAVYQVTGDVMHLRFDVVPVTGLPFKFAMSVSANGVGF